MSDHLSSLQSLNDPVIDLTDLYFFPVPGKAGRLALVQNTFPNARPGAAFSDAVVYRFRLAPAVIGDDGIPRADASREVRIDVTFSDVDQRTGRQAGTFRTGDRAVAFATGEAGMVEGGDVSVFAGLRLDPFFMDVKRAAATFKTGRLSFTDPGENTSSEQNVLSIVVELDAGLLGPGPGPLWAAVAQTVSTGNPEARYERLGRPEAKNFLLSVNNNDPVNRTVDLRDLYNLEDPFTAAPSQADAYRSRFDANLTLLDRLDPPASWKAGDDGHHPLTGLYLHDYLVADITKPLDPHGFLEIERAAALGRANRSCGGRWLNDDVIDRLFTVAVHGWDGDAVRDGVDAATSPAADRFPYLREPNANPPLPDLGIPGHAEQPR